MIRASFTDMMTLERHGYRVAKYGDKGWTLADPEGDFLMIGDHGCVAPRQADAVMEGFVRIENDAR
jgi:hypothetical protein